MENDVKTRLWDRLVSLSVKLIGKVEQHRARHIAILVSCAPSFGAAFAMDDLSSGAASLSLYWLVIPLLVAVLWLPLRWKYSRHMRELESGKNLLQTVLDNTQEAIFAVDQNLMIYFANDTAAKIFRTTADNLRGKSLEICFASPSDCANADGHGTAEVLCRRANQHEFPAEVNFQKTIISGKPNYIVSIHDISERRRLDLMRDEFISSVSHELRTPLTSVVAALGLVRGTMEKDLPANVVSLIDIAQRNSVNLSQLIDDILDSAKLDAGRIKLEQKPERMSELIEAIISENRPFAEKFDVSLVFDNRLAGERVFLDSKRFQQVLANLISNAVKYSPRYGKVIVCAESTDDAVRIAVQDFGVGIPVEFQSKIFGRFNQAASADSNKTKGTGLGLAISKQLVELMSGKISFISKEKQGTTFFVDFPLYLGGN